MSSEGQAIGRHEISTNDNSNPQGGSKYKQPLEQVRVEDKKKAARGPEPREKENQGETHTSPKTPSKDQSHMRVPPTKKDTRKLFVGGLASNVEDSDFLSFFEQFGAVVDSVVMFDKDTRRSRGFGFVTFKEQSVASDVLNMGRQEPHRIKINGKVCEVKAAEPKVNGQLPRTFTIPRTHVSTKRNVDNVPRKDQISGDVMTTRENKVLGGAQILPSETNFDGADSVGHVNSGHGFDGHFGHYLPGGWMQPPAEFSPYFGAVPTGPVNYPPRPGWQDSQGNPMIAFNMMTHVPGNYSHYHGGLGQQGPAFDPFYNFQNLAHYNLPMGTMGLNGHGTFPGFGDATPYYGHMGHVLPPYSHMPVDPGPQFKSGEEKQEESD